MIVEVGDMNRWEALSRKIIIPMYVLGLSGMLVIVIAVLMTRQYDTGLHRDDSYMNISGSWTLDREGTKPVDLNQLGESITVCLRWTRLPVLCTGPRMCTPKS